MGLRLVVGSVIAWLVCSSSVGLAAAQVTTPPAGEAGGKAVVNLNTATVAQLETLPGVGPQTAARIKEYRDQNGGFKKVEDLMKIKGIGEKAFLRLRGLVVVAPLPAAEAGKGTGGRQ